MKKLMIAAVVAFAAIASQAAQVKWVTTDEPKGVDTVALTGNGVYDASGIGMKSGSSLTFVMTFYEAGTSTIVDTWEDAVKYKASSPKNINLSWPATDNTLELNHNYDYTIVVTGTQNDLKGIIGDYNYDAAIVTATLSGSFKTESSGATTITKDISSWTVSGAVPAAPIPEPTSGLLLLLGVAGMALRRRRA